ncbi:Oidioi.mRNA.OKI2018_I69.XSR.g14578.t1.cds [Oikopleura dioica]|uniref:Oidioi.mRNA.OKI2018_I69.XSR.g14578.t1.cds n=1 Tax=Oikopleura dioica TaxID=34765 RepID=A0ABN7SHJ0_OIKDI|nr:Oidioi.mRNA.OKI2018_I69.XSR.g14578.t1.cds [Oikopleura dioica]
MKVLLAIIAAVRGLTCEDGQVKTFFKMTEAERNANWDDVSKDLLRNTLTSAYRKHNNDQNAEIAWGEETRRVSFCLRVKDNVNNESARKIREAIYYLKPNIYGAMQTNESVLVFDGVPKTYVIEEESRQWLYPYYAFMGLGLIGIAASLYASAKENKVDEAEEEEMEETERKSSISPSDVNTNYQSIEKGDGFESHADDGEAAF